MDEPRTTTTIRLSEREKKFIMRKAKKLKMRFSSYLRAAAILYEGDRIEKEN